MTRKEMIETIAKQAGCSKRLVRKKLFQMSSRSKRDRRYNRLKFNEAFLDRTTDWQDWYEVHDAWKKGDHSGKSPFEIPNLFEVCYFPSGCNIMLRIEHYYGEGWEEFSTIEWCGTRLYNFKGAR